MKYSAHFGKQRWTSCYVCGCLGLKCTYGGVLQGAGCLLCSAAERQVGNHASQHQPTGSQNPAPHHTLSTVMMDTIDFNFILFIYGNVRLFLSLGYFFI